MPLAKYILRPGINREGTDYSNYGLTSQGYENLSMTMGEVTRYLEQILHIVGYYREMDEEEEDTK